MDKELEKQEENTLIKFFSFNTSFKQPVISSVVKCISGRGVRKAERGYINKTF